MAARRSARSKPPARDAEPRRVGLFVEGVTLQTPQRRDDLRELWRDQCRVLGRFPPDRIDVYGFTKQQLVLMAPEHAALPGAGKVPLDVFIELKHREVPFHTLVVAFDAIPANQAIKVAPRAPCLRLEKDFVLERFAASDRLPLPFRAASRALLTHYQGSRGRPRDATRPPIGDVELVYMEPTFEALVLQDVRALRAVFDLKKTPKTWPALPHTGGRPDFALRTIVDAHFKTGPRYLRVPYDARKHAWAHEVLKKASPTSPIWRHPIAERLRKVLS